MTDKQLKDLEDFIELKIVQALIDTIYSGESKEQKSQELDNVLDRMRAVVKKSFSKGAKK